MTGSGQSGSRLSGMAQQGRPALHIVVADDDPLIRMVLRLALQSDGIIVTELETGNGVLDAVAATGASLVILDAHMPGPDLGQLMETLRPPQHDRVVPVLILSGDPDLASLADEQAAIAFKQKPVDMSDLLSTVTRLLEHRNDAVSL
jgi:DNA-binding NtrC family response regulator